MSSGTSVDTENPIVASITFGDDALLAGETTTVTIEFSESVTGFIVNDIGFDSVTSALGNDFQEVAGTNGKKYTVTLEALNNVNDSSN